MAGDEPDYKPLHEDPRLDALEDRLNRAEGDAAKRTGKDRKDDKNQRMASRVLTDLVGGVLGGLFVGFCIDYFLDTSPWFLLIFMFGGVFVAFRNIWKLSKTQGGNE